MKANEYLDYLIQTAVNYELGFSSHPPAGAELALLKQILIDENKLKEKK